MDIRDNGGEAKPGLLESRACREGCASCQDSKAVAPGMSSNDPEAGQVHRSLSQIVQSHICQEPDGAAVAVVLTPQKPAREEEVQVTPVKCTVVGHTRRLKQKSTVHVRISESARAHMAHVISKLGCKGLQGNPCREQFLHMPIPDCRICGRKKHATRWATRQNNSGRSIVSGSLCLACIMACKILDVPKSWHILEDCPEALHAITCQSHAIHHEWTRSGHAECKCYECTAAK